MADDQFNSMQAHMGVVPGMGIAPQMQTPTPGETSMRLMEQARQQQLSMQSASMAVSQQFQQRLQYIQQQQSLSPFAAQMMAQNMPWATPQYQGGMLPSPITMTPPSTGVFRPSPPQVTQPIPPSYTPPIMQTPFTPRMPAPMFQTPYEQFNRGIEQQQGRMASFGSQVPYGIGTAAGFAGAAYAGSQLGGAIGGGTGRLIGAIGGAALAGVSGFASGVGNVAQAPFNPRVQNLQMGSAIERMSQDWVVTGNQLSSSGRGLGRTSSLQLAQGFRDMSADRGFQQQTGGMFNREDMMRMTGLAGQAGLLDMSQNVPQIQQRMKEVARTVKEFMQLTNDPDVTNVIREMGRLQQFGLNPQQMQQAASNMRMYSRAAGTSIQGLQQMGGMPGAMTYQQAGLTAGQGFQYGNYSAAMARQAVASGTYSPQQLALMGGVQGITQRNTQAQAAFMTMPLMGAAFGQYGAGGGGGWSANQGAIAGGAQGGAFGLVNQAMGNMGQAVRRGGLGAMAMFPLQQREIQDQMAAEMTPEQQTAMRFQMAMQTGQRLNRGRGGAGAFAMGARLMYGDDVAQDMMYQARNPEMWGAQRQSLRQRQTELAMSQRAENAAIGYGPGTQLAQPFRKAGTAISDFGSGIGTAFRGVGTSVSNWIEDNKARAAGMTIDRVDPKYLTSGRRGRSAALSAFNKGKLRDVGVTGSEFGGEGPDWSNETLRQAIDWGESSAGNTAANVSGTIGKGAMSVAGPVGAALSIGTAAVEGITGVDLIREGQNALLAATMDQDSKTGTIRGKAIQSRRFQDVFQRSKAEGKAQRDLQKAGVAAIWGKEGKEEEKQWGKEIAQISKDYYSKSISDTGAELARVLKDRSGIIGMLPGQEDKLNPADIENALKNRVGADKWNKMSIGEKNTAMSAAMNAAREFGGPELKEAFDKSEENIAKLNKGVTADALKSLRKGVQEKIGYMETMMDLDADIGGVSVFEKTGAKEFRAAIQSGASGQDVAMLSLALNEKDADPKQRRQIEREKESLMKQLVGKGKPFKTADEFYQRYNSISAMKQAVGGKEGWSENLETRIKGLRGEGATADKIVGNVENMQAAAGFEIRAAGLQAMGFEGAIQAAATGGRRGAAGIGGLTDEGLSGYFAGKEGQADIAMMKERGGMDRKRALIAERAAKGDKKAKELLGKMVEQAGQPQEKTEKPVVEAGGEEAQKLKASEDAMSEMQAAFSSFTPAVDDFAAGAKALREAMENEWINRKRED